MRPSARQAGVRRALLAISLDHLEPGFRDSEGRLLSAGVAALRRNLRSTDHAAGSEDDRLVVCLEDITSAADAARIAQRILRIFNQPLDIDGQQHFVTANVGIAMYPTDGLSQGELIRHAGLASSRAKAEGRSGYRFFDRTRADQDGGGPCLERAIRRAMANQELGVAFQPLIEIRSGTVTGAEALLRWCGNGTDPAISELVAVAEESGLILPIGQWVIGKAVHQLSQWTGQGRELRMSVNLSAVQIHRQDVLGIITQSLKTHSVQPGSLKAEITESVLLDQSDRLRNSLCALHEAGIGLVLDDFGTGYSSLTYLRQFPIETIKVDRSFINGVGSCWNDEAIVSSVIRMAHSLGQTVVAEGVETREQLDFLRDQGCDFAQGYFFSGAVPAEEFGRLLM